MQLNYQKTKAASEYLWASKYSTPQQVYRCTPNNYITTGESFASTWISFHGELRNAIVFLADLANSNLILCESLPISIQIGPDGVAAYSYDIDELATGSDTSSALDEMRVLIAESYRILKEEKDNLGPLQACHWNFLSRVIRER